MDVRVDPRLFHEFYFKIAMSMRLPLTSSKIIEEFVDIDVNSDAVSKIILRNQYFEYFVTKEIKNLGFKKDIPSLKAAIVLMGMQSVRNFVCALQMMRMVGRLHPKPDKDGKLNLKPTDMLKYALRSEEFIVSRKMQYTDTAYAAGMMFDLMVTIGREFFKTAKPFEDYVEEVYKHGLRTARIAVELSKNFKNLGFAKFVFSAALIHDIGKLAMDLLFPVGIANSYQAFRSDVQKKPANRDVVHFIEAKRFGLTHEYYSAQMAYYFGIFRGVERAILYHHAPYLVLGTNREIHNLACLIALSTNIANNYRVPRDSKDPIMKAWITPELRDFRMDPREILKTMEGLSRSESI